MRRNRTEPSDGEPTSAAAGPRRVADLLSTIRGRIFVAFLIMSLITGALGLYATLGIRQAGVLVNRTYDQSLMSINYARAAATDFAKMRAAFVRRTIAPDAAARTRLDEELADLAINLAEDLTIAVERSQSDRATRAGIAVQGAVSTWDEIRRGLDLTATSSTAWEALDRQAAIVDGQIDMLVNYTAGDGFTYRQTARNVVASEIRFYAAATGIALLLSAIVAWLLNRRIMRPVKAASAVAERIAAGRLDDAIPIGGRDELGALLRAMGTMRDNIRAMMAREVSQRRSAQAMLADALESSREGVVVVDAEGRIALANAQAADFFGGSAGAMEAGTPVEGLVARGADPAARVLDSVHTLVRDGEVRLADGRWLRVSRSATQAGGFVAVCSDISVLKEQEARLTTTNLRLDAALDNMSQGLCLYDANYRLMVVNRRYCEIYGLAPGSIIAGMTANDVLRRCLQAGNHPGRTLSDLQHEEAEAFGRPENRTFLQELGDGRIVAIEKRSTADGGFVATYEDVTERRHAEARIAFMARHDALTNLPNRIFLGEQIDSAIAQAGRDSGFAVHCLNLDDFKLVNDTLGHVIGDELLRAAASRLGACVREIDSLARLGGDEFAIVQRGVDRPEDSAVLARRIIDVLGAPYTLADQTITIGVSIGISLAPSDGMSCEKLLKNADVALDRAKAEARGSFRFFEPEMDARLQARRLLERDLREAVTAESFELHYQPIYDLNAERVCGFEALLRWNHPERGRISPAEFIPLAEELGLIIPLGEWVMRRACQEASRWPDGLKVAVNVSAVQFTSARLIGAVRDALAVSGLPGRRLELEITESVLVANPGTTTAMLHSLKGLGARVSMDDFGTGYSSLSYLRSFPFDKIKIDQSFVRDLGQADDSGFIVRAVIGLGASLGMTTTAEGVETEAQLARLRGEGCDEVQGYLFSRPVPSSEIPGLLRRWNGEARAIA
ncbi:EAL domain-containing protein [Methylobacterium planeticum]|uniref:EAL domain-containing protein n=1 Tax=Methylobacterium planeticum TaxID=2615211 RepID=A0A6N6MTH9_9HYPH|nr:EAL domain-containing protein [Methylobacterium planeticum]KAB1073927.1 EAL domain-containing protein [Methylobacterium planeticum]